MLEFLKPEDAKSRRTWIKTRRGKVVSQNLAELDWNRSYPKQKLTEQSTGSAEDHNSPSNLAYSDHEHPENLDS